MRVEVRYGRHSKYEILICPACGGDGRVTWLASGIIEMCKQCAGRGQLDWAQGYCYETGDGTVSIGDVVRVPPTPVNPEPQDATVVRLGSDYAGTPVTILCVIERGEP